MQGTVVGEKLLSNGPTMGAFSAWWSNFRTTGSFQVFSTPNFFVGCLIDQ